jgi:hypothetical protein
MPGNLHGIMADLTTSHVSPERSYTPRWVRDRRRFDDTGLRVRVILGDLNVLTRYVLDIRASLEYYENQNRTRFYELKMKGDNK